MLTIINCFCVAYYVAFGPHGPRSPANPPGTTPKILAGVSGLIIAATALYYGFRALGLCLDEFAYSWCLMKIRSPTSSEDNVEGVARGVKRTREGAEDEPHLWLVIFDTETFFLELNHFFFSLGITSDGYSGKGFVTRE